MSDVSNRIYDFIDNRSDDVTKQIYDVAFIKDNLDNDGLFLENAITTLFNNLYEDGYLTNKPTVFAGLINNSNKVSIELFLDK